MRAKDAGIDIALHRGSGASLPGWRCLVGAGSLGGDVVRVPCGYHGLLLAMGQFGLGGGGGGPGAFGIGWTYFDCCSQGLISWGRLFSN